MKTLSTPRRPSPQRARKSSTRRARSSAASRRATAAALQACFVDLAQEDNITPAQIAQLGLAGAPWSGVGLQCSNGLGAFPAWFPSAWRAARASPQYGRTWFRFAYAYLVVSIDGAHQADFALDQIGLAGGFGDGDLWIGVDVERGEQPADATKADVQTCTRAFSARILERTGKRPILYAGSYTRELGISDLMGCWALWYPQWSRSLSWATVASMGASIRNTLLWQDVGDGSDTAPPGYPHTTPIGSHLDISILVRDNLPYADGLEWIRTHAGAQPL